jgi:HAD superfamily phosphoserine phosphatase-like hydrolase
VKGLSRLPVTEEIAGSNPVERAKKIRPPSGERIFLVHRTFCYSNLMDIPSGFLYSDEQSLQKKLADFKVAGASNIHFVFDFDRTLSVLHPGKKGDITSWIILKEHTSPEAKQLFKELYEKYRPKEVAGTMTEADAVDWWSKVLDSFVASRLNVLAVEKDFLDRATIRPGTTELFKASDELNIPSVILSAGFKGVIDVWNRVYNIHPTLIVSTKLEMNEDGTLVGWDRNSLVHTLNKDEADHEELATIRAERPYAIVIGDGIADADMADGDETVLRIRLLDPRPDEIIDLPTERARTFERFDALIENRSLESVVDLLKEITR